ncbi:trans-sialidase [Trypanosoma rangeli SC58]|uniref:Trans-sialidase n=1 Tax=Trypanosoma rangeli SC58 TaxID=429131 RepID=A0A061IWM7_TRYRA|nr:trans-sialidase [Trypanosoma rangeli SC58]
MPWQLFYSAVLLLLCVLSMCGSGSGAAASDQTGAVSPFTGTTPMAAKWEEVADAAAFVTSLRVPSLVEVNGDVFAVAEAQCKKGDSGSSSFTGIVSVLLKKDDVDSKEIPTTDASVCCTQLLKGSDADDAKAVEIMQPTTMVVGSDVYMLRGKLRAAQSLDRQRPGEGGVGLVRRDRRHDEG